MLASTALIWWTHCIKHLFSPGLFDWDIFQRQSTFTSESTVSPAPLQRHCFYFWFSWTTVCQSTHEVFYLTLCEWKPHNKCLHFSAASIQKSLTSSLHCCGHPESPQTRGRRRLPGFPHVSPYLFFISCLCVKHGIKLMPCQRTLLYHYSAGGPSRSPPVRLPAERTCVSVDVIECGLARLTRKPHVEHHRGDASPAHRGFRDVTQAERRTDVWNTTTYSGFCRVVLDSVLTVVTPTGSGASALFWFGSYCSNDQSRVIQLHWKW